MTISVPAVDKKDAFFSACCDPVPHSLFLSAAGSAGPPRRQLNPRAFCGIISEGAIALPPIPLRQLLDGREGLGRKIAGQGDLCKRIRIPLRPQDQDVLLRLQPLVEQAYQNGRYEDLDYRAALDPPLNADDAAWTEQWLRSQGKR